MLVGRRAEREAVERLLVEAQRGRSAAPVLSREPDVGEAALLQHVRAAAASSGFRMADAVGVESEAEFAFAGLHQLCAPLLSEPPGCPDPSRRRWVWRWGCAPVRRRTGSWWGSPP